MTILQVLIPQLDSNQKLEFKRQLMLLKPSGILRKLLNQLQLILILWKLIVWKKSLVWKIFQLTKQSST